jgi:outer membrane protein OmpA-like peptidoglycan-associated protein/tetratricopeptide (TPR) repeat protein
MKKLTFFVVLFAWASTLLSQNHLKTLRLAEKYFDNGSYDEALKYYQILLDSDPDNMDYFYAIGQCYEYGNQKEKALEYYLKVYEKFPLYSTTLKAKIAVGYHLSTQFDNALKFYELASKDLIPGMPRKQIKYLMAQCSTGKALIKKRINIRVENMGSAINTFADEYGPCFTLDENTLFFTSNRPTALGDTNRNTGKKYDDVYIAQQKYGKWTPAQNIDAPVNTNRYESALCVTADGQELYFYRNDGQGDIFTSKLKGTTWQPPKPLSKNINSAYLETSVFISADGQYLFLTSDKKGGYGGRDIYYCKKQPNGTWSNPINCGPKINTQYDEDCPFLHPDGETFYFSSNSTKSMGGYDVFVCKWSEKNVSEVYNMGYPLNTPDEDINFVISADGKRGYYASGRTGGLGGKDIYVIYFVDTKSPQFASIPITPKKLLVMTGTVKDALTKKPLGAEISVLSYQKNSVVAQSQANEASGSFQFALPNGDMYAIDAYFPGYELYSENIEIDEKADFGKKQVEILLKPVQAGSTMVLKNLQFAGKQYLLNDIAKNELKKFYEVVKGKPDLKITIKGHTDNTLQGEEALMLSQQRAEEVKNYLVSLGIEKERIIAIGLGEKQPLNPENTDLARKQNRRIEIELGQ